MTIKKPPAFHFESALSELNQLVEKLEQGGLPLEESLHNFEKGITLVRQCQKVLLDTEQKVQILMEKQGETKLSPYIPNSEIGD